MTDNKKAAQVASTGTAQNIASSERKGTKKIDRVIAALRRPHGLNVFEAERIGDHSLPSTVAVIRQRYGDRLIQKWETVPTRFNPNGVKVCRYWLLGAN